MSTYEEVRDAMVEILSGREQVTRMPQQWVELQNETALALDRRAGRPLPDHSNGLLLKTPLLDLRTAGAAGVMSHGNSRHGPSPRGSA